MRRLRRVIVLAVTGCVIVSSGIASASHWDPTTSNGAYAPALSIVSGTLVDSPDNLTMMVSQRKNDDIVSKYGIHIASGWRFAVGAITNAPSSFTSCASFDPNNPTQINSNMEG